MNLEIEKAADGFVIKLTQQQMARLGLREGDILAAKVLKNGSARFDLDRDHSETIRIGREVMVEYRETFEKLAKS